MVIKEGITKPNYQQNHTKSKDGFVVVKVWLLLFNSIK